MQDAAKDAGESVVPLSWEGRDYFLFLLPGDRFTVSYASLIPQETVYQQSFRFQMMFAMFLLLLGIPCAFLTVYFALRHIRPIRELSRSLGAKQHTQDDFSAIRSGIETLVGQNMDLHTRLDASLSARRAEFVRLFADTRFPSRETAVEAARGVDLAIDRAYYLTAVVSTAGGEDPGLEKMEPPAEFEGKIVLCGAEIVSEGRSLLLVFADDPETLSRWAETAYASLSAACMEPVMAVSNVHSDFSQAGTAYLEASAAYDGSPVMGGSFVLRFSDISQASEDREILLYRFAGRFYGILKSGSREEMEIWIRDLSQLLAQKKVSLSAFRLFVSDLTGVLLDKYGEGSGDLSAALRDYDIFALSRCRRVGELVDALRRLCTGFWEIRDTTPGALRKTRPSRPRSTGSRCSASRVHKEFPKRPPPAVFSYTVPPQTAMRKGPLSFAAAGLIVYFCRPLSFLKGIKTTCFVKSKKRPTENVCGYILRYFFTLRSFFFLRL